MKNSSALRAFLIASLMGVLLLLILSNILEPKFVQIKDIKALLLNQKVKVQGQIQNIRNYKDSDFQVILIKDNTGEIEITIDKIINLKNLQSITVIGKITEYEKDLQITAEKIILG